MSLHAAVGSEDIAVPSLTMNALATDAIAPAIGTFEVECVAPDGSTRWRDTVRNIVTVTGKQVALDVVFGAAAKPSWFVLLKGTGTPAAGDTLTTHATWAEVTAYTGNRPGVTFSAATVVSTTGAQVTHAAAASFAINGAATVAGAGACTAATGTTGTLYNAGDFASPRTVASGDTLNVTLTLSLTP